MVVNLKKNLHFIVSVVLSFMYTNTQIQSLNFSKRKKKQKKKRCNEINQYNLTFRHFETEHPTAI